VYPRLSLSQLFDTVLALWKGSKPTHFGLHVFHHSAVVFMAYFWLEHCQSLQFCGLLFNTFVHIPMYRYYAIVSSHDPSKPRLKIWWKNHITHLQIIQFVTSFVLASVTVYLMQYRECAGRAAFIGNASFNAILLLQFIQVLAKNSKRDKSTKSKSK
jgi:magnesium-transporting ATPase (P-type)